MKMEIVFISKNEELYKSFKRAFKVIYDVQISVPKRRFTHDNIVVVYDLVRNAKELERWLCSMFRQKSRNPLVVLGVVDKESFIQENSAFRNHPYNHAYLTIPFELQQLVDILNKIKPIYDEDTRKFIVKDYCKNYECCRLCNKKIHSQSRQ
jgi:hypothetical protein